MVDADFRKAGYALQQSFSKVNVHSNNLEVFIKRQILIWYLVVPGQGLRFCISNKLLGDEVAARLEIIF